ncbi:MAG TPA: hypothetical protein VMY98_01080 [Anaerolineae bacterium]|nr:hypothetical protein [Anaerolineae bacterium]
MRQSYTLHTKPRKEHAERDLLESRGTEVIFDRRLSSADRAQVPIDIPGRLTVCQIDLNCLDRA